MRTWIGVMGLLAMLGIGAPAQEPQKGPATGATCDLKVEGMSCGACAARFERGSQDRRCDGCKGRPSNCEGADHLRPGEDVTLRDRKEGHGAERLRGDGDCTESEVAPPLEHRAHQRCRVRAPVRRSGGVINRPPNRIRPTPRLTSELGAPALYVFGSVARRRGPCTQRRGRVGQFDGQRRLAALWISGHCWKTRCTRAWTW
jgi:hypothetical protein